MGAGEPANGAAPSQTDPIQETSRRSSTTHGRRSGRPPRLPDAVYDEIADALAAEAERMASLGSSPGTGYGVEGAEADARGRMRRPSPRRDDQSFRGGLRGAKAADRDGG